MSILSTTGENCTCLIRSEIKNEICEIYETITSYSKIYFENDTNNFLRNFYYNHIIKDVIVCNSCNYKCMNCLSYKIHNYYCKNNYFICDGFDD